ncbi:kinase-like domain-containing protein, partial [Vararia minispora EC-137]
DTEPYPVLRADNQIVLYDPTSHALSIRRTDPRAELARAHRTSLLCPYCSRPLSDSDDDSDDESHSLGGSAYFDAAIPHERAANYFQLLEVANDTLSRPTTPPLTEPGAQVQLGEEHSEHAPEGAFRKEAMAEGYFKTFFVEEARLGMGANGSVYLCQHVLNGNPLGRFAIKKIAVGQSSAYLLQILREVRLLESLHHPNIVTYHHAWLENAQFSSFGPPVPTLHVLMQWAEGGSLDDYIEMRLGHSSNGDAPSATDGPLDTRSGRIRAFRALQRAAPEEKARLRTRLGLSERERVRTAVHLFSAEEVLGLFRGIVDGLAFLHDKSILHLDLKPANVLLTWDERGLVPRAMLSDFGTSRDMVTTQGARTGNTGTLEYTSPESLPSPPHFRIPPVDSKADMWSLGMVLYKLLFFRLPYRWASDGDAKRDGASEGTAMDSLEREVRAYEGFKATPVLETAFKSRRLSHAYLVLLENLLHITPGMRPSCERVQSAVHRGQ